MIAGLLKAALAFIPGGGLATKGAVLLVTLATVAIGAGVIYHKIYQRGVDDTIAKIAKNDTRLVQRALKAKHKVDDCSLRKREWDQSTGECR